MLLLTMTWEISLLLWNVHGELFVHVVFWLIFLLQIVSEFRFLLRDFTKITRSLLAWDIVTLHSEKIALV